MDPLWLIIAFVMGFVARLINLPPLVGFLVAGFILNEFDIEGGDIIKTVSDLGVQLLLFSIGLKLQIRSLLKPQIWGTATAHMAITVIIMGLTLLGLSAIGVGAFAELDTGKALLVAFALSFSSTVFAIKVFESKGEMHNLHARMSIGILIMQDIFAIVFMTLSSGKIPSPWALALLALPLLRPVLFGLMNRAGHGELLVLMGLLLALGSADLFAALKLKPDLGPLLMGILIGGHPKSNELAKTLLGFKDLFLTGFFLSIGLSGAPSLATLGVAALLVAAVPFKTALFFWLLTRLRVRARTSLLTSLSLANYSEFGLIVGTVSFSAGWLPGEWLVIIAIGVSLTFALAAPLNTAAQSLYVRFGSGLRRFEGSERLQEEQPIATGDAEVVIFGMGRVGTGAYDFICENHGNCVLGIEAEADRVKSHVEAGRRVIKGDATDSDLWDRVEPGKVHIVILAMSNHASNLHAAERLQQNGFEGIVAASAQYEDHLAQLRHAGVDAAVNFYERAGIGLAEAVEEAFACKLPRDYGAQGADVRP